uniref:Beta-1,4-N-acetylgalactosaminyltransferase n=1 Tax=Denticeps clupeoides TaxID=299321 RepID=A0AAY4DSB7_9TELE
MGGILGNTPEPWRPEYHGKVNLHVFQDWCGRSTRDLRKNVLYPLYPHTRSKVTRLAVSPKWSNYGLRIFGYLHPDQDGEYIFAIASDDNSEFWMSDDESPKNLKLVASIGKTGLEWTVPGEYTKFFDQISQPVQLKKSTRYYFEVIHKQNEGADHVEVAWRLNSDDSDFHVIGSKHLSLYRDESFLLMGDIAHIPQTIASHEISVGQVLKQINPKVDMLKKDPRDTIFEIPLMNETYLQNLFPECLYKPSYIFQGSFVGRYQGLNHVHLSSVFPNDFTRQTHTDPDFAAVCWCDLNYLYLHRLIFDKYVEANPAEEPFNPEAFRPEKSSSIVMLFCILLSDSIPKASNASLLEKSGEVQKDFPVPHINLRKPKPVETEERNVVYEDDALWERVFNVKEIDFQPQRTDAVVRVCRRAGNVVMNKKAIMPVVHAIMKKLNKKHPRCVLNVERRVDGTLGSRYLVELELKTMQGDNMLFSHYVYTPRSQAQEQQDGSGQSELPPVCNPTGFAWNPKATVHIAIPVRNQARWIMHLIKEMEKIYRATRDENFSLIIIDYNSDDMDVEAALQSAFLPRFQYKRLTGPFERSGGLQVAADIVDDDHSIILLCDLHLHYPLNFIDTIRKHTVEGKMVFAPVVMRLDCGSSPLEPTGFWELQGYGLMGIYKSDMKKIGGMNTKEFKDKWGGEDWEMLDRVIQNKYEVERLHLRNFLHFFHTKRGMWNSRVRKPSA